MKKPFARRILPLMLVMAMMLSGIPPFGATVMALGASGQDACTAHTEHDEDCGYIEAVEGADCTFEHMHNDDCGFDGEDEESCNYDPASHEHDGECDYIEAVEGQACTHSCELCETEIVGDDAPETDLGLPNEVAATVQPDGVILPDDAEMPLARVTVGEVDTVIVPMAGETTAADVKTTLDNFGASAGGTVTVNGNIVTFSSGTATISGTNSLTIPAGVTLVIDGGILNITHSNSTNNSAGIYNNGTITLANGTLKVANTNMRGIQNNGMITISGGTLDIENSSYSTGVGILNNSDAPAGTINITDGTVNIQNSTGTGISSLSVSTTDSERGKLNISGGSINIANTGGTGIRNSGDITISGSANITVASSGTTGINNYVSTSAASPHLTGKITMSSGTLTIANTAGKGLQNSGNSNNSATLTITGGTFQGGTGPAGNIELAAGSKVTVTANIFTDGDTLVTATDEITVGAADAAPNANRLSAGTYQWGGTNFNKPNAVITSVTAGTTTIVSSGGDSVITVAGTTLANGIKVTAFDGATATTTGTTTGSATSQQVTLTFPANSSTMDDKVYTIRVSLDGGTTWDSATATVTVSKASVSTSTLTASPATLTFGNQTVGTTSTTQDIIVTGSNLTADISHNTPLGFTITKAAGWDNRTGGTLQVAFSPTAAQPYSIGISITSTGADAKTVMLSGTGTASSTPTITSVSASQTTLAAAGGTSTVTVTGTNLPTGITVTAFDGASPAVPAITGTTDATGKVTLTFPANASTTDDAVYTIKASLDGGANWSASTATVTVYKVGTTTYALTVNSGTGGGNYTAGASVTITANAAPTGQVFDRWTGGNGGSFANANDASTTFTMPANAATVTATYKSSGGNPDPTYYTISVSANPSAGGSVSGGGSFAENTSHTVTATANSNYSFKNWTEGSTVVSTSASYTFTLTGNCSLVANFTSINDDDNSGGTTPDKPTIEVSEIAVSALKGLEKYVTATANVEKAFSRSVEVRLTDDKTATETFTSLLGAGYGRILAFDISLYVKGTNQKTTPADGHYVTFNIPLPKELWDERERIKVGHIKDGTLEILSSKLAWANDMWNIVFDANNFSPFALLTEVSATDDTGGSGDSSGGGAGGGSGSASRPSASTTQSTSAGQTPKTKDDTNLTGWTLLLITSILLAAYTASKLIRKKY